MYAALPTLRWTENRNVFGKHSVAQGRPFHEGNRTRAPRNFMEPTQSQ
jgi:hypothetical protein